MPETRESLKTTYNAISSRFDATRRKTWKEVEDFIKMQEKGSLILDLAAGTGRHSVYAGKLGMLPVAGDFSISQLRELRKKQKGIPCVMLDLTDLPFRDNVFDAIIYIAAIHHLDTEKKRIVSMKESARALKTGRTILASAWALNQPRFSGRTVSGDIRHTWDGTHPRFYHLFTTEELKETAEKAGLKVLQCSRVKDNIYVLAQKENTRGAIKF